MALQSSGAISISQIRNEQVNNGGFGSTYSLRALSANAGFSTADAMSEFYGYSAAPATHNVYINLYYPNYVGCYAYTYFAAVASEAVNTTLQVTMYWYGDLGGAFQAPVYIGVGTTCGSNSSVYTSATNCYGEYFSTWNAYLSPSSSGNQTYVFNTYYLDLVPC
jgi:hypothetical protein